MHERQLRGACAESAAARLLESHGATILLRNYRRRAGEIDLVARLDDVLIIAEVRLRASAAFGGSAASVDRPKQARIIRAAQQLLQQRRDLARLRVRFDVLAVSPAPAGVPAGDDAYSIEWIQHAFSS